MPAPWSWRVWTIPTFVTKKTSSADSEAYMWYGVGLYVFVLECYCSASDLCLWRFWMDELAWFLVSEWVRSLYVTRKTCLTNPNWTFPSRRMCLFNISKTPNLIYLRYCTHFYFSKNCFLFGGLRSCCAQRYGAQRRASDLCRWRFWKDGLAWFPVSEWVKSKK